MIKTVVNTSFLPPLGFTLSSYSPEQVLQQELTPLSQVEGLNNGRRSDTSINGSFINYDVIAIVGLYPSAGWPFVSALIHRIHELVRCHVVI